MSIEKVLREISNSDAGYAGAARSVLESVSASNIQGIELPDSVKQVMGTNGIPDLSVTGIEQLLIVADAMARALIRATADSGDDDDLAPYYDALRAFRATYENLTDAQLRDYADASFFQNMTSLERKAAASVLIDLAVDRRQTPSDVWIQISNDMGGN